MSDGGRLTKLILNIHRGWDKLCIIIKKKAVKFASIDSSWFASIDSSWFDIKMR